MEVLPSDIQSLPQLCAANTDKHLNSLLYIEMINESGHQVTGHVDLADKVSKRYWKESMDNSKWLVPTMTDLTFHNRGQVNYCSSSNWEVEIKNNVVTLRHR